VYSFLKYLDREEADLFVEECENVQECERRRVTFGQVLNVIDGLFRI
jgi:hypothetical protein